MVQDQQLRSSSFLKSFLKLNYIHMFCDCFLSGVATADHPISIFRFGIGFVPDALCDTILPFYLGLGPALRVYPSWLCWFLAQESNPGYCSEAQDPVAGPSGTFTLQCNSTKHNIDVLSRAPPQQQGRIQFRNFLSEILQKPRTARIG